MPAVWCHGLLVAKLALQTVELTRLQVGDTASTDVNIIVSTVLEAENIVPLLLEYKSAGRNVNVRAFFFFLSLVAAYLWNTGRAETHMMSTYSPFHVHHPLLT